MNRKQGIEITLSLIRSDSLSINLFKNEFGSRDRVVFVVKKIVPPTFNLIHWLLPCFVNKFGLFIEVKLTVAIISCLLNQSTLKNYKFLIFFYFLLKKNDRSNSVYI